MIEKEKTVSFINEDLRNLFNDLKDGKFEEQEIHKWIAKSMDELKENPEKGTKIRRKVWPKVYIQEYRITNLWKYDLPKAWRLIYTIDENKIEIMSIILEWFNHKEYEKRFGY
ncbi:type II toxin-antitoxin system RelE/ParE family toxin [Candidatus Woesearchaeota archaeon]|nr:type II toxin-antitoxin system RelE/ParE family toxin [Candidatus Woesearchaeota archaeon]